MKTHYIFFLRRLGALLYSLTLSWSRSAEDGLRKLQAHAGKKTYPFHRSWFLARRRAESLLIGALFEILKILITVVEVWNWCDSRILKISITTLESLNRFLR